MGAGSYEIRSNLSNSTAQRAHHGGVPGGVGVAGGAAAGGGSLMRSFTTTPLWSAGLEGVIASTPQPTTVPVAFTPVTTTVPATDTAAPATAAVVVTTVQPGSARAPAKASDATAVQRARRPTLALCMVRRHLGRLLAAIDRKSVV